MNAFTVDQKVNYYDFGMRLPVYDTPIDIGNTLKNNLENYLLYKQDEMQHKTNVKATMTNWTTHKTNAEFKALSDIVLMVAKDMVKTPAPLYTSECWGAVYTQGQETKVHNHWPYLWSWCYYVKTPDGSSPLVFPESKMMFEPNEGELIIFSSLAKHYVPPCSCEDKRIMIAGNIGLQEI